MRKLVKLFNQAKGMDVYLKSQIRYVFTMMIKYHFRDDSKQTKEMLYMVTEILSNYEFEQLNSIQRMEYLHKIDKEEDQKIIQKQADQLQEKDRTIEQQAQRIKELEDLNNTG